MHRTVLLVALVALIPAVSWAKINVKDYGAKADGKTDDTAAIQKALDAAAIGHYFADG